MTIHKHWRATVDRLNEDLPRFWSYPTAFWSRFAGKTAYSCKPAHRQYMPILRLIFLNKYSCSDVKKLLNFENLRTTLCKLDEAPPYLVRLQNFCHLCVKRGFLLKRTCTFLEMVIWLALDTWTLVTFLCNSAGSNMVSIGGSNFGQTPGTFNISKNRQLLLPCVGSFAVGQTKTLSTGMFWGSTTYNLRCW